MTKKKKKGDAAFVLFLGLALIGSYAATRLRLSVAWRNLVGDDAFLPSLIWRAVHGEYPYRLSVLLPVQRFRGPEEVARMIARPSWKAYLRLSLVTIPVQGYTAHETAQDVPLHQIHKPCHSRIRYKKTCPVHGEVPRDEIVSGYEFAKDQYVEIDLEELDKLRTQSDKAINIDAFVSPDAGDCDGLG